MSAKAKWLVLSILVLSGITLVGCPTPSGVSFSFKDYFPLEKTEANHQWLYSAAGEGPGFTYQLEVIGKLNAAGPEAWLLREKVGNDNPSPIALVKFTDLPPFPGSATWYVAKYTDYVNAKLSDAYTLGVPGGFRVFELDLMQNRFDWPFTLTWFTYVSGDLSSVLTSLAGASQSSFGDSYRQITDCVLAQRATSIISLIPGLGIQPERLYGKDVGPLATKPADGSGAFKFLQRENDPVEAGVANASLTGYVDDEITLDGSSTHDPDNDPITYAWTIESKPSGSGVTLTDADKPIAKFTPKGPADKGSYKLNLVATDNFQFDQLTTKTDAPYSDQNGPLTISFKEIDVNIPNRTPEAKIDAAPNPAYADQLVTLHGAGSFDLDHDPLTYQWTLTKPVDSNAALSGATSETATFTVDKKGAYGVTLVVNDGTVNSAAASVNIDVPNQKPVAKIVAPDTAYVDQVVTLDGSGSSDPDHYDDTIKAYAWSFDSIPAGSGATIADADKAVAHFTVDKKGDYTVKLIVNDGVPLKVPSDPVLFTIHVPNQKPVANIAPIPGPVHVGDVATLNGSGSSDPDRFDDHIAAWSWSITKQPAGSAATIVNPTAMIATLTPDESGDYEVQLVVEDSDPSTPLWSDPVAVAFNVPNRPPVADAGPNQTGLVDQEVTLTGSGTDPDNDPIVTWTWSFVSTPPDSQAVITDADKPVAKFTPDKNGVYVVQLVVNDGDLNSPASQTTVSMNNRAPVANAGTQQTVYVGEVAVVDGSGSSDLDHDTLSYSWTLVFRPAGSAATLQDADTVAAKLAPDKEGLYVAQLVVSDGFGGTSAPSNVQVHAPNHPPVPQIATSVNNLEVTLDGTGSYDPDNSPAPLTYLWTVTKPNGDAAVVTTPNQPVASFTFDQTGEYTITLTVWDGDGPLNLVTTSVPLTH